MKKLYIFALALFIAGFSDARADSLAKHIEGFSDVIVRIEGGSATCGIKDDPRYKARIVNELAQAGLAFDPTAITKVHLFVWGEAFGMLKQQCAVFTAIRFGADMEIGAAKVEGGFKGDAVLIDRIKVVRGTVPANFYTVANQAVQLVPETPEYINDAITKLIQQFAKERM